MKPDKNILNELQEISPLLYKMRQESGNPFSVPTGYFDTLKSDVFRVIDTGIADDIGKASFKVPENYFEQLTTNIMDRIETEEVVETESGGVVIDLQTHRRRESFSVRRMSVMAASVAIFLLLGVFTARFFLQDSVVNTEMAISQDDAIEYIEDNYSEFESEDLLALVDLTDEDIALDVPDDLGYELEQYLEEYIDEIDEYLLTNEI